MLPSVSQRNENLGCSVPKASCVTHYSFITNSINEYLARRMFLEGLWTKAGSFFGVILVKPYLCPKPGQCLKSLKKYSVDSGEGVAVAIIASIQG